MDVGRQGQAKPAPRITLAMSQWAQPAADSPPPSPTVLNALHDLLGETVSVALTDGTVFDSEFRFAQDLDGAASGPQPLLKVEPQQRAPLSPALREKVNQLVTEWQDRRRVDARRLGNADLQSLKRQLKQQLRAFDLAFEKEVGRAPEKLDKHPLRAVYTYYKALKIELQTRGLATNQQDSDTGRDLRDRALSMSQRPQPQTQPTQRSLPTPHPPPHPEPTAEPDNNAPEAVPPRRWGSGASLRERDRERVPEPPADPPNGSAQAPVSARTLESPATVRTTASHALDTSAMTETEIGALRQEKKVLKRKLFAFMKEFEQVHGREVKTREDRQPLAAEYERYRVLKATLQEVDKEKDAAGKT